MRFNEYMTVKQLADKRGVTKEAIRKRLTDEFRDTYVDKLEDGTLIISLDGCKLIEDSLRTANSTANGGTNGTNPTNNSDTNGATNCDNNTLILIDTLREQLAAKDEQIAALNRRLEEMERGSSELRDLLKANQELMKAEKTEKLLLLSTKEKRGVLDKLKGVFRKADPENE